MQLTFLGGTGTVTGSKFSIELGWQVCVPEYQETVAIDAVR